MHCSETAQKSNYIIDNAQMSNYNKPTTINNGMISHKNESVKDERKCGKS